MDPAVRREYVDTSPGVVRRADAHDACALGTRMAGGDVPRGTLPASGVEARYGGGVSYIATAVGPSLSRRTEHATWAIPSTSQRVKDPMRHAGLRRSRTKRLRTGASARARPAPGAPATRVDTPRCPGPLDESQVCQTHAGRPSGVALNPTTWLRPDNRCGTDLRYLRRRKDECIPRGVPRCLTARSRLGVSLPTRRTSTGAEWCGSSRPPPQRFMVPRGTLSPPAPERQRRSPGSPLGQGDRGDAAERATPSRTLAPSQRSPTTLRSNGRCRLSASEPRRAPAYVILSGCGLFASVSIFDESIRDHRQQSPLHRARRGPPPAGADAHLWWKRLWEDLPA